MTKSSALRDDKPTNTEVASGPGWTGFLPSLIATGGAWALVIARPMYVAMASGPEAMTSIGMRRFDILLLVVAVSFLVPVLIALIGLLLGRTFGQSIRSVFFSLVIATLVGLFFWQQVDDSAAWIRLLLPLLAIAVLTSLLLRSRFIQNFAVMLGIAIPVVIVSFLVSYPVWDAFGPGKSEASTETISADTPVVLVVFDELPLASLENGKGQIDGRLFPNVAALARKSNWYPGMRATATSTTLALPAILASKRPTIKWTEQEPPPGLPEYPNNICSVAAAGGYEVHSYEPITDLCHRSNGLGSRITEAIRRGTGASEETQAVQIAPGGIAPKVANRLASPFKRPYDPYDGDRAGAVDDFVNGLSSDKRSLGVLHITLPHINWQFMPDGSQYQANRFQGAGSLTSPASKAQVTQDFQQYMLQMAYTDHELGRVIGKMKEEGTWNDALFIVTADHGAGFIPGGSRRILEVPNAGWILPVPLFVKFPGQEKGKVIKGDANSLDIAPTVYDALGVKAPSGTEGVSLTGKSRLPSRRRFSSHGVFGPQEFSSRNVNRLFRDAVTQRNETFSGGQLFALSGNRDLLGKDPDSVEGLEPVPTTLDQASELADVDKSSDEYLPSYIRATFGSDVAPDTPLAVALNGKIVATTRTWLDDSTQEVASAINVPDQDLVDGANVVAFYEMNKTPAS